MIVILIIVMVKMNMNILMFCNDIEDDVVVGILMYDTTSQPFGRRLSNHQRSVKQHKMLIFSFIIQRETLNHLLPSPIFQVSAMQVSTVP